MLSLPTQGTYLIAQHQQKIIPIILIKGLA